MVTWQYEWPRPRRPMRARIDSRFEVRTVLSSQHRTITLYSILLCTSVHIEPDAICTGTVDRMTMVVTRSIDVGTVFELLRAVLIVAMCSIIIMIQSTLPGPSNGVRTPMNPELVSIPSASRPTHVVL